VVLVALGLLVGACSGGDKDEDLAPHPPEEPVTSVIDYSGVVLEGVPGSTTTTIREVGTASIVGSVTGPGGPVPGATVRIEHITGTKGVRGADVLTGPDGRFELRNIPGGRYRVRAFLAPALALVTPDIRFIKDGEETAFDLKVEDQRKLVARAAVAPASPYLGDDVNLAVVVATRAVDPDGIVRSTPIPNLQVELDGLGTYALRSDQPSGGVLLPRSFTTTTTFVPPPSTIGFTDGVGEVRYALSCVAPGTPGLALLVSVTVSETPVEGQPPPVPTQRTEHLALDVPPCIDPATLTTTSTTPADGGEGATTTDATDR
jgi:hypothetical protein